MIVAVDMASQMAGHRTDDAAMARMPAAMALGLNDAALVRIVLESKTDIEMLQAALG